MDVFTLIIGAAIGVVIVKHLEIYDCFRQLFPRLMTRKSCKTCGMSCGNNCTNIPAIYTPPLRHRTQNLTMDTDIEPVQPPPTLDTLVKKYEAAHNSSVIFINHGRVKSMYGIEKIFGIENEMLTISDAKTLITMLRKLPVDRDLNIILNTNGGSMAATEIIVKALLSRTGSVRVYIPFHAESAGTFIALCGTEIHLGQFGWLGQVDPQCLGGRVSACTLVETAKNCKSGIIGDLLNLAAVGGSKALDRAVDLATAIHAKRLVKTVQFATINDLLIQGKSNHEKPLTSELLLGSIPTLAIGVPDEIMELFDAHNNSNNSTSRGPLGF